MYCNECGYKNEEGGKFCIKCGNKFSSSFKNNTECTISQNEVPFPYVISITKLIVLSIATFGLYEIYWFYKQWKSINSLLDLKRGKFSLSISAFFAGFTSFSLFKHIAKIIKEANKDKEIRPTLLATLFFIFLILSRLPSYAGWASFLAGILVLIPVQNALNNYWENKYEERLVKSKFSTWNYVWAVIGAIVIILALHGTYNTNNNSTPQTFKEAYRESFIKSCKNSDPSKETYCTCVANYMITNYNEIDLTKFSATYQLSGKISKEITIGVDSCLGSSQ